jgi:hypothetical protein
MAKGGYTLKVFQYQNGNLIKVFNNTIELIECGFDRRGVNAVINGKRKSYLGFTWEAERVYIKKKVKIKAVKSTIKAAKPPRRAKSLEYNTWKSMLDRCYNKNGDAYKYYGGRGIAVCEEWRNSYENFLKDMGNRPGREYSIERINTNGNYEPSNCKWGTRSEQAHNRRDSHRLFKDGQQISISEVSNKSGVSYRALVARIRNGWEVERIINTPLVKNSKPVEIDTDKLTQLVKQNFKISQISRILNVNYYTVYGRIKAMGLR